MCTQANKECHAGREHQPYDSFVIWLMHALDAMADSYCSWSARRRLPAIRIAINRNLYQTGSINDAGSSGNSIGEVRHAIATTTQCLITTRTHSRQRYLCPAADSCPGDTRPGATAEVPGARTVSRDLAGIPTVVGMPADYGLYINKYKQPVDVWPNTANRAPDDNGPDLQSNRACSRVAGQMTHRSGRRTVLSRRQPDIWLSPALLQTSSAQYPASSPVGVVRRPIT